MTTLHREIGEIGELGRQRRSISQIFVFLNSWLVANVPTFSLISL